VDSKSKIDEMLRRKREGPEREGLQREGLENADSVVKPVAQPEQHGSRLDQINAMLQQKRESAQQQPPVPDVAPISEVVPQPVVETQAVTDNHSYTHLQSTDSIEAALNDGNAAFYYGGFIGGQNREQRKRRRRR